MSWKTILKQERIKVYEGNHTIFHTGLFNDRLKNIMKKHFSNDEGSLTGHLRKKDGQIRAVFESMGLDNFMEEVKGAYNNISKYLDTKDDIVFSFVKDGKKKTPQVKTGNVGTFSSKFQEANKMQE